MEIVTTTAEEEYQRSFKTNVFITAFTASLAQLKLYDTLDFLGYRAVYSDTETVIYKTKPGQEKLPLGLFLGDFTDELGGDKTVEFVSGGAKNYGYLTRKGKVECKVHWVYPQLQNSLDPKLRNDESQHLESARRPLGRTACDSNHHS